MHATDAQQILGDLSFHLFENLSSDTLCNPLSKNTYDYTPYIDNDYYILINESCQIIYETMNQGINESLNDSTKQRTSQ